MTGSVCLGSRDHPSWIISSCGFESSWYPFDVTRTSCSRLQVPNLLVTEGSMVKTISFCTSFSPAYHTCSAIWDPAEDRSHECSFQAHGPMRACILDSVS